MSDSQNKNDKKPESDFSIIDVLPTESLSDSEAVSQETPTEVTEKPGKKEPVSATGKRITFTNLTRNLTDQELVQTGVQKMLLEELERAEIRVEELEKYKEKYFQCDKELNIAKGKLNSNNVFEIMTSSGMALGGIIFGTFKYFSDKDDIAFMLLVMILGVLLITLSSFAKFKNTKYES